jgi:hypothetical protein
LHVSIAAQNVYGYGPAIWRHDYDAKLAGGCECGVRAGLKLQDRSPGAAKYLVPWLQLHPYADVYLNEIRITNTLDVKVVSGRHRSYSDLGGRVHRDKVRNQQARQQTNKSSEFRTK